MSRDWTPKEIAAVSEYMKRSGNMGYEEFAAGLKRQDLVLDMRCLPFDVKYRL